MENNIYTVLVIVALLVLGAAVGYVAWRHNAVFGGNPFSVSLSETRDLIRAGLHLA